MNCDEYRLEVLAGAESASTHAHEQSCPSCRARADELRSASALLRDPELWEEPAPEIADQVEALISTSAGRDRHRETPRAQPRARRAALGAAAVVVLIVGIAFFSRNGAADWEVTLPPTELAPSASASAQGWNRPAGTRMVVDIDGLDPAPPGFVYEFWLSDGPIHVSAGTFQNGGTIELWSGVGRRDFPRLWITLEPLDEDESPSGVTVLDTGAVDS